MPESLLSLIAPTCVIVEETRQDLDEPLYPEEKAYIFRAVERRRREFVTVRHCAALALGRLGERRPVQVPGAHGEPTWPYAVVGSMTHCEGYRAAAVAPRSSVRSIGIDAEVNAPLPEGVLQVVARGSELSGLRDLRAGEGSVAYDRLLFSIKESLFKAWFPIVQTWMDFEDAKVRLLQNGSFVAVVSLPNGVAVPCRGRWRGADGLLVTMVALAPSSSMPG